VTAPIPDTRTFGDFAALQSLKRGARENDPAAVRQVAQQFESLFARMMIKSMRDAIGKDPIFGSDQAQTYQGMFDDQLAIELTKGHGLGLADMLVRQLQMKAGATASTGSSASATSAVGSAPPASAAERQRFITELLPQAHEAAQRLGVDPASLIAQAALESNWGRSVPQGADGRSSNNLFGIKADAQWTGPAVSAATHEFQSGERTATHAAFRAYASRAQSFDDYVAQLAGNPRYRATLGNGTNASAFASAVQQGGYATDPDYASKLTTLAQQVATEMPSMQDTSLKFASVLPITSGASTL